MRPTVDRHLGRLRGGKVRHVLRLAVFVGIVTLRGVDFMQKSTSCAPCTALPSVLAETRTCSSKVCISSLSP
jgi:hypothetical protein